MSWSLHYPALEGLLLAMSCQQSQVTEFGVFVVFQLSPALFLPCLACLDLDQHQH